jgi:predicted RNA binding protein YcfA (HicA-like mRNA interferase family)
VNEDMPADLAPAVYYVGDYGKMVVATTANNKLKKGWLTKIISKFKK